MISSSVVLDQKRLSEEVKYFLDRDAFVFDIESVGPRREMPQDNQVTWLSMATQGRAITIPMGHPNGNRMLEKPRRKKNPVTKKFDMFPAVYDAPPVQMRPSAVFETLEPLFFSEDHDIGAHKAVFDFFSVAKYFGGRVPGVPTRRHCTLTQAWLINENSQLGLKDIIKRNYKRVYDKENTGRRVEIHPFNKVATYSYMDSKFLWFTFLRQLEEIQAEGLTRVYELEQDTLDVLCDISLHGTPVDEARMKELDAELSAERTRIEIEVYKAAGKQFNLNSNPQKVAIFYGTKEEGGQGLRPWKLTKGGLTKQKNGEEITLKDYSTDQESLEQFAGNTLVDRFLEFQEVDRILTNYIHAYLGKDGEPGKILDGKVYPGFLQYGTVTGRFSCNAPNLQNIPRPDTELGKKIRSLFVAGEGHKLIVADYGQVELVVLAHFVGKGALYDGFYAGIDPHTMTAAMIFNQDPHDLTARVKEGDPEAKDWRQISKNVNFAIVYGAGPDKVASMSKIKVRRAKEILAIHERQFPEIYTFKDTALEVCRSRKPPHLRTLEGRKRRLPAIMSSDWGTRGRAERQAINSLIQGSAADLIKTAMVRVNHGLKREDAGHLLLTVHDELVARATVDNAEKVEAIMREGMVGSDIQAMVDVPLSIDLHIVDNWAAAK